MLKVILRITIRKGKKKKRAMAFGLWAVFQIKFAKLGSILGSPRDH